jgi:YD repeat-containing protein
VNHKKQNLVTRPPVFRNFWRHRCDRELRLRHPEPAEYPSGSGWSETYAYDGFGNLTDKTPTGTNCLKNVGKLSNALSQSAVGETLSAAGLFDQAATETILNGVGSSQPVSALYGPGAA